MAKYAQLSDGTRLEFPDETAPEVMDRAVKQHLGVSGQQAQQPKTQTESVMRRLGLIRDQQPGQSQYGGLGEEAVGLGESALSLASGALAGPVSGLAGIGAALIPGGRTGAQAVEGTANAMTYQPRGRVGQRTNAAIAKPFEMLDRAATYLGDPTESGSPLVATGIKTALLAAPMALARGMRSGPRPTAPRPARVPVPEVADLKSAASDAYESANNAGVIISRDAMARVAREIKGEMANEGIDATLHPDSMAALNRLMASGEEHASLKGAEILRRVIKDAEASTKPADARMASRMRDAFDERMEGLAGSDVLSGESGLAMQSLQNARQLYARARKSEDIQELFHRAELKAGANYTAAGIETALRQEFRALAMNNRRMRGFNAEERAAIEKVAKGGPVQNAVRLLGKFAPSGAVSTALSTGLGFMFGGPIGAAALPAAGAIAKQGAARATIANANRASELVRRGPGNSLYRAPEATQNALTRPRQ